MQAKEAVMTNEAYQVLEVVSLGRDGENRNERKGVSIEKNIVHKRWAL